MIDMQNNGTTMELALFTGMSQEQLKAFLAVAVKEALAELLGPKRLGAAPQNPDDEPMVTVAEAARITGLAVNTLYDKTYQRAIPHYKRGKRVYFRASELLAWIGGGRVKTQDEIDAAAATHVITHPANQWQNKKGGKGKR